MPSKFCFTPMPKRRKTSEARIARTEHRNIIEELTTSVLSGPSASISSDVEVMDSHVLPAKPTTRDIGIQCGK